MRCKRVCGQGEGEVEVGSCVSENDAYRIVNVSLHSAINVHPALDVSFVQQLFDLHHLGLHIPLVA